ARRRDLRQGIWDELRRGSWLPYALCAVAFLALRFTVLGVMDSRTTVTPLDNPLAFVPPVVRIRSALGVLWDYFALLAVPLVLAADYSYAQVPIVRQWLDPRCLAGAALLATAVITCTRAQRPALRLAAALPFIALALTSNLVFPIGTSKAERLLYL